MIKTLRISDKTHKKVIKIQGRIMTKRGEFVSIDKVIAELIDAYNIKLFRSRNG